MIVTISADGATSGRVDILADGQVIGTRSVEIPGGATRQIIISVVPQQWQPTLSARYVPDKGSEILSTDRIPAQAETIRTIGLLGSLNAQQLTSTGGGPAPVQLSEVKPEWLGLASPVLGGIDNLAATSRDLSQLPTDAIEDIEQFVFDGGQLILVDSTDAVGRLPSAGPYGLGSVVQVESVTSVDGLERVAVITPTISQFFGADPGESAAGMLLADSNYSVAAIKTLVGLVLAFIFVTTVAAYWFLRRTDRETSYWGLVPASAVIATGLLWGVGTIQRGRATTSHATVTIDTADGGLESKEILLSSPSGGWTSIRVSDDWQVTPQTSISNTGEIVVSEAEARGDQVGIDLAPGGIGTVRVERYVDSPEPAFEFEIVGNDGAVTGTVTNLTDYTLEKVAVVSGAGFHAVDTLGPGQTATINLTNVDQPLFATNYLNDYLWQDIWNGQGTDGATNGATNPSALTATLRSRQVAKMPGQIMAIGWTRDASDRLGAAEVGRTAFVSIRRTSDLIPDSGSLSTRLAVKSSAIQTDTGMALFTLIEAPTGATLDGTEVSLVQGNTSIWRTGSWEAMEDGPLVLDNPNQTTVWLQIANADEVIWGGLGEQVLPRFEWEGASQ